MNIDNHLCGLYISPIRFLESKKIFSIFQVRDLMNWVSELRTAMMTQEKVRDAASAQSLKAEHDAIKAEIEAREESFQTVMELGEALVQGGHYAANVSFLTGGFLTV